MAELTATQQAQIRNIVADFPGILLQAKTDWAKFKAGVNAGLFPSNSADRRNIINWFAEFPKLWDGIKPNFNTTVNGTLAEYDAAVINSAETFVNKLRSEPEIANQLGIAPLIIAGILIAAAFGIGGVIWAIGYLQKQSNISHLIDGVVAGKIPSDVLEDAIKKENEGGILSDMTGLLKWAAIGAALYLLYPTLKSILSPSKTVEVK